MERKYILKFDGELRGRKTGRMYQWKRGVPFIADVDDMRDLNPMMYHTRPLVPEKHVPKVEKRTEVIVPLRIESKKNGWHTLYKGGLRVFSSRSLEEVKQRKREYANG